MPNLTSRSRLIMAVIFIAAFLVRFSTLVYAHHGDLNNNISWGTIAYEKGFNDFYEGFNVGEKCPTAENGKVRCSDKSITDWPYSAPNQPPLTIYSFTLSRFLWQHIRNFIWYMNWELVIFPSKAVWFWDEKGMDVLAKLPSVIADFGIAYLIYNYFKKRNHQKAAIAVSGIWLLNPVTWYNSAVWGQTDSVVNFLGLIGILALIETKFVKFALFLTLSLLYKPSLSVFIPVLLIIVIKQRHKLNVWLKGFFISLGAVTLISVWFHPHQGLYLWLYNLYVKNFIPGEIGYLTANSFNFWWLVDSGKVYDNTLYFGLSARIWGILLTITGIFIVLINLNKKIKDKDIFFALAASALIIFLFMTRIHERYLYPFFPLAAILLSLIPKFWIPYFVLSAIHLLNLYNYFWVPDIPALKDLLLTNSFPQLLSLINIFSLPLIFYLYNRDSKSFSK